MSKKQQVGRDHKSVEWTKWISNDSQKCIDQYVSSQKHKKAQRPISWQFVVNTFHYRFQKQLRLLINNGGWKNKHPSAKYLEIVMVLIRTKSGSHFMILGSVWLDKDIMTLFGYPPSKSRSGFSCWHSKALEIPLHNAKFAKW